MSSIANQFLQELGAGSSIKDYAHASKIFLSDNFRLAPKYSWLFHVSFDFNDQITNLGRDHALEMGLMVKSVTLPTYKVDTKTFNAYNRPNIVQNQLKYQSVNIDFHDDSADVVRNFWFDYMNYYYRDADYGYANGSSIDSSKYRQAHKYSERDGTQSWGYQPATYDSNNSERYINAIRLYSLHQRKFTEYILINPTIVDFAHGRHENGSNDLMTNTMTVEFETVLYAFGRIDPDNNTDFATLYYDKTPSPLTPQGGGTNSILGPGGLLSAIDGTVEALGQGNLLGAGFTAFKSFENFKGTDFVDMAKTELTQIGRDILGGMNPLNRIQIPSLGGLLNGGGASNFGPQVFGLARLATLTGSQSTGTGAPGADSSRAQSLTAGAAAQVVLASSAGLLAQQATPSGTGTTYQNVVNSNGEGVATAYRVPAPNITTSRLFTEPTNQGSTGA